MKDRYALTIADETSNKRTCDGRRVTTLYYSERRAAENAWNAYGNRPWAQLVDRYFDFTIRFRNV